MIRVTIEKNQIGIVLQDGDVRRVLSAGRHYVPERVLPGVTVARLNQRITRLAHSKLDAIVESPALRDLLTVVDLGEDERAIVWRDGRLYDVVAAGRFAYWNAPYALKVETFSATATRFTHPQLNAILAREDARTQLVGIDVEPHERLLVRRGGELIGVFGPGRHAFWRLGGAVTWQDVDMREQLADIGGQEIMTADNVTLRLNLTVTWQITDPVAATTVVASAGQALYREAQLALRAAVSARDLERVLTDKADLSNEVRDAIAGRVNEFGVRVVSTGIRDIVLPGDMKAILNQVIEARKQAEANLIRRREETAAARSQANTARLLAEHPVLMRMKELESLEAILRGTRSTFVFGTGDLTAQMKTLVASQKDGDE